MNALPRVSVFLAISLDGCIAGPAHELEWLQPYSGDSAEDTGYQALMDSVDALLLGRNSYDAVSRFPDWPYAGKRVWVLSHSALAVGAGVETVDGGDLLEVLQRMHAAGIQHVYADGGHIARQAISAGVVSQLTLHVVPQILGRGIRLFEQGMPGSGWQLLQARALPSGLAQLVYQPAQA